MKITSNNQIKNFIYKAGAEKLLTCLYSADPKCSKKAIQAHSIQNKGVLEEIAEDGHVMILNLVQDLDNGPRLEFQRLGRNKATTFTGLCNEHDTLLFQSIDLNPIDISNQDHLFLLSYRSVLRELHTQYRAASMTQKIYIKSLELDHLDSGKSNKLMMSATVGLMEAYGFFNYANIWHKAYLNQKFDSIQHSIITIPSTEAKIAVSSVYALVDNMKTPEGREIPKCIAFNIFPYEGGIVAIWSYPTVQHDHFTSHLDELSQAEGDYRKYILSKLVLRYCENFVLTPSFYNSLSPQQIESIKKYYLANIPVGDVNYEDKSLFLF